MDIAAPILAALLAAQGAPPAPLLPPAPQAVLAAAPSTEPEPDAVIEALDGFNHRTILYSIWSRKENGATVYRISDCRLAAETRVRDADSPLETHGGVPETTLSQLLSKYDAGASALGEGGRFATANGQVRLRVAAGKCTTAEAALLLFWIDEFFLFG